MVAIIDAVKGQNLSKVIDVYSMLLIRSMVAFGEDRNFIRIGFNYFTEIGLRFLLVMKNLVDPSKVLLTKEDSIPNEKFIDVLQAISSLKVKDQYQSRVQSLIDYSKKYIGREINTTNVQDSALKQMVNTFRRYQIKMIQQPEVKESERILMLILDMVDAYMRRVDLQDYSRVFKSPSFMKAVSGNNKYISAEKEWFKTIKNFGMSYRTYFIFRNYYSMMIKKFKNELNRSGKIVKDKPNFTKKDLEMVHWLTTFVDKIVKILEKVEWFTAPEIL